MSRDPCIFTNDLWVHDPNSLRKLNLALTPRGPWTHIYGKKIDCFDNGLAPISTLHHYIITTNTILSHTMIFNRNSVKIQLFSTKKIPTEIIVCSDGSPPFWPREWDITLNSNTLWPSWILVNIRSRNGLLPCGINPLPEPMFTYHQ